MKSMPTHYYTHDYSYTTLHLEEAYMNPKDQSKIMNKATLIKFFFTKMERRGKYAKSYQHFRNY